MDAGRNAIAIAMAAIVLVAVFYLAGHRRPAAMTNVSGGNHPVAPAFLLTDLNGRRLELSNYRGKVVLLDFWATWCAPCRTEIPHFVELQKQYGTQGFQVVGISMDDGPKPVREFYDRFHLNYPVAMGDEQVADAYGGILGLPVNILVSRDGRICARHAGLTDANILEQEIAAQLQRTGEPAAPK